MRRCLIGLPLSLALLAVPGISRADILSVESTSVNVGGMINVPVTISGVSDLYAFQFDLSFNPSILQLQSITEGPFLGTAGPTFFIPGTIDNIAGTASFTVDTLIGSIPGASCAVPGSCPGTLATFDFRAIGFGTSPLDLSNVVLLNPAGNDIPVTAASGVVSAVPEVSSAWLLLTVLIGCALLRKIRKAVPYVRQKSGSAI